MLKGGFCAEQPAREGS